MKILIWLTLTLLWQDLSVMAADKADAQQRTISSVSQQTIYSDFDTSKQMRYTGETPEPLHFNSLTIKTTEKGVLLNWEVEEAANLQYFLIEQAVDGQSFLPLFEVPVQPNQHAYSFADTRMKQDGKAIIYRVKAVYPTVVLESPVRKLIASAN